MDIGIAMILAVSLNIVNGMTGQFSLGHAAFMALGGYVAGIVTYYGSMLIWGTAAKHGGFLGAGEWLFAAACVVGGCVATLAGYVVGLALVAAARRLPGDRHAGIRRNPARDSAADEQGDRRCRRASLGEHFAACAAAGWRCRRVPRRAKIHDVCFGCTRS